MKKFVFSELKKKSFFFLAEVLCSFCSCVLNENGEPPFIVNKTMGLLIGPMPGFGQIKTREI